MKRLFSIFALVTGLSVAASATDIVDTAISAGNFKTFVAAVKAAGLVETLKSEGPFTVFAPTDEAFAKLPSGTVESLLLPENLTKLQDILRFHVVLGSASPTDVVKLYSSKTVEGQGSAIHTAGDGAMVDNVHVIKLLNSSNGVIHVIDTVILPR